MSRRILSPLVLSALFCALAALPALADSQIRIVRLSYVAGNVQVSHTPGQYEKGIMNLPITQGMLVRTAIDGRAEIEFEDGGTLRLAPATTVLFPRLSLLDSGGKFSTADIKQGTAYLNFSGATNDEFDVLFGREKIALTHAAHLRIGVDKAGADVAVLKGDIQVDAPSGTVDVKKNQTADFDFAANDRMTLAKNIQEEPYDAWDKQQDQFYQRYASNSQTSYSPYSYGVADLSYYGNFFNAPGYGMMWQPYFIGAGWDPFMNGAWAFSQGFGGYGWVSSYPWGWTPYHYGTWMFLPGYGWAWQPGGAWMPWYTQPVLMNAPAGFIAPKRPITGSTLVAVNRGPVISAGKPGSKLLIRNNSAGLGVPRGEIGDLAKVSQKVQQKGEVAERLHPAPVEMAPNFGGMPSRGEMNRGAMNHGITEPGPSERPSSERSMSAPEPQMSAPEPGGMGPASSHGSAPGPRK
jgi:FecR protein